MFIGVSGTLVASQRFLRPLPTSEFQCVAERVATFLGVSMLISLPPHHAHLASTPSLPPSNLPHIFLLLILSSINPFLSFCSFITTFITDKNIHNTNNKFGLTGG